jgi:hypothetical protein
MAHCIRPDAALSVRALVSFCSMPTVVHFATMLDIICHVSGTDECQITSGHNIAPLKVWCDANFATCEDTHRSTNGSVAAISSRAVSRGSRQRRYLR